MPGGGPGATRGLRWPGWRRAHGRGRGAVCTAGQSGPDCLNQTRARTGRHPALQTTPVPSRHPDPRQPCQGPHTLPALQGDCAQPPGQRVGLAPTAPFHVASKRRGDLSSQSTASALWDGDGALLAPERPPILACLILLSAAKACSRILAGEAGWETACYAVWRILSFCLVPTHHSTCVYLLVHGRVHRHACAVCAGNSMT